MSFSLKMSRVKATKPRLTIGFAFTWTFREPLAARKSLPNPVHLKDPSMRWSRCGLTHGLHILYHAKCSFAFSPVFNDKEGGFEVINEFMPHILDFCCDDLFARHLFVAPCIASPR
jgi:hypothetical protein